MRLKLVLLLALVALPLVGCAGGEDDEAARELYGIYRSTEDVRSKAEERLRRAFSDIALAADERNRGGVLSAVQRGELAAGDIERLLEKEIDAAVGLERFDRLSADADRLKRGLEETRQGLRLFVAQLRVGARDPFLDDDASGSEVRRLAHRAAKLSVDGEFAIRRSDRALALALGIEPRFDVLFDAPRASDL
jgi:hypothetical protein